MAKKHNFTMADIELTFDKTHILAWQTRYQDFEFANYLNRLYDLQLARELDYVYVSAKGNPIKCVNYLYYDDTKQLMYIMIENQTNGEPVAQGTDLYDKILIIYGRDAKECCLELYGEFKDGVTTQGDWDLLGKEHQALMNEVMEHGVMYVDYFDFSCKEPEDWQTSVMHTGNAAVDKKIDKRLRNIHDGLEDLLMDLELKISNEEVIAKQEERMVNNPLEFVFDSGKI